MPTSGDFWEISSSNCISDTCVIDIEPLPGNLVRGSGTGFYSIVGCDSDGSWYRSSIIFNESSPWKLNGCDLCCVWFSGSVHPGTEDLEM